MSVPKIYLCFEPDQQVCAEKLHNWPVTNADFAAYERRMLISPNSAEAEPIKDELRRQIAEADVTVCIISYLTAHNEWIDWELTAAKQGTKRNYLVGILLHEHDEHPPAMVNSGAIFTRFRRDAVDSAIAWAMAEKKTEDDFTFWDD
jgi:hypothetical protein